MLSRFIVAAFLGLNSVPAASADTATFRTIPATPQLDGNIGEAEYGPPTAGIVTGAGAVRVWLTRHGGSLYIAAHIPDSTFYWGDDLVVSIDADGSGGRAPSSGDRQWYLRRTTDSSVVGTVGPGASGRWNAPGQQPPMLGSVRHNASWDVASTSTRNGWTIELRVSETLLSSSGGAPRIAFRTYNDAPQGWWSLPQPPAGVPVQRVEYTPELWIPMILR